MNFRIAPEKEPQFLFMLALFAFLELVIAGAATLSINPDPKNALVFGFSALRLLLVGGIWILAVIVLWAGLTARKKRISLDSAWLVDRNKNLRQSIYAISFVLIVWGWLSLFCPAYLFGRQVYIFERIRPVSIALGISLVQSWLFYLFTRGRLAFRASARSVYSEYSRPTLIFAIALLGLGILIASTKFGLPASLIYSNVPGIPLSGLQWFFILVLVGLWIAFVPGLGQDQSFMRVLKRYRLIPILIFITSVLVWGLTPLPGHFFSLEPAAPGYQPFPYSDARLYDLGGISILRGFGIYFQRNFDKPLYMIFLAILHSFAASNYTLMTWLQILFLALIPVIVFYFGARFHSTAFGIFLSTVLILRQRNAIVLSYKISSVNPKLFMTEDMALLGMVLLLCLVFIWIRDRKVWQALLCGGCVGAVSLLRFNSLILFPALACLVVPVFWRMGRKFLLRQLSIYTLAFLILLVPWVISSVDPQGTPWLFLKLDDMIHQRYGRTDASIQGKLVNPLETELAPVKVDGKVIPTLQSGSYQAQPTQGYVRDPRPQNSGDILTKNAQEENGNPYRFLYHLFHNFSTSVLSLPDSLKYDDLETLSKRTYWSDTGGWEGNLPAVQTGLVFINLVLLAIGLGYSWVHHRWAGMIPLTIFIAYSVSLSIAMNSGGRYLVPMDWVLFFYHGLAILVIGKFILKVLAGRDQSRLSRPETGTTRRITDRARFWISLAGIIFLAGLVPIANFAMPVLTASARNQPELQAAKDNIIARAGPGVELIYGEIHYPYYEKDLLTFDFLTPTGADSYEISRTPGLKAELNGGEHAFIAMRKNDQGNAHVELLYLWQGGDPVLVWQHQP